MGTTKPSAHYCLLARVYVILAKRVVHAVKCKILGFTMQLTCAGHADINPACDTDLVQLLALLTKNPLDSSPTSQAAFHFAAYCCVHITQEVAPFLSCTGSNHALLQQDRPSEGLARVKA